MSQTDRQFIQTYTYSASSQHKLYNEICVVYIHICEMKNEQISVSLTVTIEKKNILHTHTHTHTHARTRTNARAFSLCLFSLCAVLYNCITHIFIDCITAIVYTSWKRFGTCHVKHHIFRWWLTGVHLWTLRRIV